MMRKLILVLLLIFLIIPVIYAGFSWETEKYILTSLNEIHKLIEIYHYIFKTDIQTLNDLRKLGIKKDLHQPGSYFEIDKNTKNILERFVDSKKQYARISYDTLNFSNLTFDEIYFRVIGRFAIKDKNIFLLKLLKKNNLPIIGNDQLYMLSYTTYTDNNIFEFVLKECVNVNHSKLLGIIIESGDTDLYKYMVKTYRRKINYYEPLANGYLLTIASKSILYKKLDIKRLTMVENIIEQYNDVNLVDSNNKTLLINFIESLEEYYPHRIKSEVMNKILLIIKKLLDKGADLDHKDNMGMSAIDYAELIKFPQIKNLFNKTLKK